MSNKFIPADINEERVFNEEETLLTIKKYLPAQAPLKDFIFQNNLEAFQNEKFHDALHQATEIFGYKTYLSLDEFRKLYHDGKIKEEVIEKVLHQKVGRDSAEWRNKMFKENYTIGSARVGKLRKSWRQFQKSDVEVLVHPTLFRIVCSYLDQGISIWNFPVWENGFIEAIKEMEHNSLSSFFRTKRAAKLLFEGKGIIDLLDILVGDESLYQEYLIDQQFIHQGWSGMVAVIENKPETLMDRKKITLKEFIILELLLEIDILDSKLGENWLPLGSSYHCRPIDIFSPVEYNEFFEVCALWQEAFEWSQYDEVLLAIQHETPQEDNVATSFQAFFCIDDREISLRDHLEHVDPHCITYGTPGFFNVEFYFQPEHGKALTKLCPAPVTPKFLIKEGGTAGINENDLHFAKRSFSLTTGWIITQTLGFWTAIELALDIFRPSIGPATASSFKHMAKTSDLSIEYRGLEDEAHGLQIGFKIEEMATRVEGLLRNIGLTENFANLVYIVGHGASSVNNPFYATMDCGACSCRPGSVNARAFSYMANHVKVRELLQEKGIKIPANTQFLGGLHDTTRDEILFYDERYLSQSNKSLHQKNLKTFEEALDRNAKERSRRFESINTKQSAKSIHKQILTRSVSLFEPRPELDHATNALTVIGKRDLTKHLFLDRRAFLNSYDYAQDLDGKLLVGIMRPIAPVCGGINLSYYFSRVDNNKLGAGTKLPHNVMGLFGVANGIDGDLRPGLPSQMVESHDPVRQLVIVEHFPDIVLKTLQALPTYPVYLNEWMHLIVVHPETKALYLFRQGQFEDYKPLPITEISQAEDLFKVIENSHSLRNIPVYRKKLKISL